MDQWQQIEMVCEDQDMSSVKVGKVMFDGKER